MCLCFWHSSLYYTHFYTIDWGLTLQFDDRDVVQNDVGNVFFMDSSVCHGNLNSRCTFVRGCQIVVTETNGFSIMFKWEGIFWIGIMLFLLSSRFP